MIIEGRRERFIRERAPVLMAVALLLAGLIGLIQPARAGAINLTYYGSGHVFEEEALGAVTENITYNSTLLHHLYYHPRLEIPPWLWIFFIVGGILFMIFSLLYHGPLQASWLTSVLSLLFLFTAQFTVFAIRDISFYSGWGYFVNETEAITAISTIQPVVIAWDWVIPFFFTLGLLIVGLLNFMVLTLEMGGPGLSYFRSNIFRRH
jgi:hypothetical protein